MPIRPALPADAEVLLTINIKARQDGYRWLVDQAYLDSRQISSEGIQRFREGIGKTRYYFVYEDEQRGVLGYIRGNTPRDENSPYPYEIGMFYVHPDHQRKGIGSLLWIAFQESIQNQPFYLWTLAGSKGEHFYLKHGGKVFGSSSKDIGGKIYPLVWYAFPINKQNV